MARPKKTKSIERLRKVLGKIPELKRLPEQSPEFEKWHRNALVAISNTFGSKTSHVMDFKNIHFSLMAFSTQTPQSEFEAAYRQGLDSAASVLESMIEEITEYWAEDEESSRTSDSQANVHKSTNKIFVIHGHDTSARETVARFLEKLELEPVILHELPNEGRTIIEKFEDYADVMFAVVLLTPDDLGTLKEQQHNLRPRARQNVVFELGYFIGKLGRKKVCALLKGDIERPSDVDGILYVSLDDEDGWKFRLLRELKAAGFGIDANQVL